MAPTKFSLHLIDRVMKDRFFQFSWRPRNSSLLGEEAQRDIAKNLKKYSEKFAKDDDMILQQVCPPALPTVPYMVLCRSPTERILKKTTCMP